MSADSSTAGPHDVVTASIVSGNGASGGAYPMFRARDISPQGALLVGGLFLEVDEEFTVELALGDRLVRATARVVRLEQAEPSAVQELAMRVSFTGLSAADLETLSMRSNVG